MVDIIIFFLGLSVVFFLSLRLRGAPNANEVLRRLLVSYSIIFIILSIVVIFFIFINGFGLPLIGKVELVVIFILTIIISTRIFLKNKI